MLVLVAAVLAIQPEAAAHLAPLEAQAGQDIQAV
jgi:hypothetical protein